MGKLLREVKPEPSLPPRFQEAVWQRIALNEGRTRLGLWAWVKRLVEVRLPRPQIAAAYLGVLLAAGMAAGALTGRLQASRLRAELGLRYVQAVNPFHADDRQP